MPVSPSAVDILKMKKGTGKEKEKERVKERNSEGKRERGTTSSGPPVTSR